MLSVHEKLAARQRPSGRRALQIKITQGMVARKQSTEKQHPSGRGRQGNPDLRPHLYKPPRNTTNDTSPTPGVDHKANQAEIPPTMNRKFKKKSSVLCEINQRHKENYSMMSCICGIYKIKNTAYRNEVKLLLPVDSGRKDVKTKTKEYKIVAIRKNNAREGIYSKKTVVENILSSTGNLPKGEIYRCS